MADNKVVIYVTSENRTKAGFDQAKKDAEQAGDDAGKGFMNKFGSWLTGGQTQWGGGGIGGILSTAFSAGPAGIGGLAAAAAALLVEVDGLVSGFAAAAAGAGAFYILGHQTISNLITDYGNMNNAQAAVQKAQDKYNLDPTKANLTALNTAKLNQAATRQVAQQDLGPAAAVVDKFATALGNLQQQFQPTLFKVIADGFQVLTDLLPVLLPLANAFAGAVEHLLGQADKFVRSTGFQAWFQRFLSLVGPATNAIGNGIGQVMKAFGSLFVIMGQKDVVDAISVAFTALSALILSLAGTIKIIMTVWDYGWHAIEQTFITTVRTILNAAVNAFGWVPGLGPQLKDAQAKFNDFANGVQGNLDGIASHGQNAYAAIAGVASAAANAALGAIGRAGPTPSKIGRLAGGGYGSGWTVVGENGPELLHLPGGSYVQPGRTVPAGMGGGGGSPVVVQLQVNPSGSNGLDALFMSWLRQSVRNYGGGGPKSVQIALGQTH